MLKRTQWSPTPSTVPALSVTAQRERGARSEPRARVADAAASRGDTTRGGRRQARAALAKENIVLVAAVPSHKKLQIRTVRDIANALDAKIVYSKR